MKLRSTIAAFILCSTSACAHAVPAQTPVLPAQNVGATTEPGPALPGVVAAAAASYPGLAYVVIEADGEIRSGATGRGADEAAFTPATRVALYSVAKPMTAALAVMLSNEGKLDLDAPIGALIEVPAAWAQTTPRQLLTHTSGMRHYRDREWLRLSRRHCATTGEALGDFINDPAVGPAGEYRYSSFGFVLLSHVLSQVSAEPFPTLFTNRIATPSGGGLSIWTDGMTPPPNGFEENRASFSPARSIDNSCKFGAGGVVGSALDLAHFGAALATGRLMPVEQAMAMVTPSAPGGTQGFAWGLGTLTDGTPFAAHSGAAIGGTSAIAINLETGRVAVLVANTDGPSLVDEARALLEVAP